MIVETKSINSEAALSISVPQPMATVSQIADTAASRNLFADYRSRKAVSTCTAHDDDLAAFTRYLADAGVKACQLTSDPDAWRGMSWGLVEGFVRWQLQQGAAISTINRRLSTVKSYVRLAAQAGAIPQPIYQMIRAVQGYTHQEGRRLDAERATIRTGAKKPLPTSLSKEQIEVLKTQPGTPQGQRDALLMCLLLDHGLRVGELALLTTDSIDLNIGMFTFYRPKVDKTQTHKLTADTLRAATAYLSSQPPPFNPQPLLRGSRKSGQLTGGMQVRAIRERVGVLGRVVGIEGLSPHDCRHAWATTAVRSGTDVKALQDAGGWNSPAMPLRYVESAAVANERVRLDG